MARPRKLIDSGKLKSKSRKKNEKPTMTNDRTPHTLCSTESYTCFVCVSCSSRNQCEEYTFTTGIFSRKCDVCLASFLDVE